MLQEIFKNQQIKGINMNNSNPQMIEMMNSPDFINMKQHLYQNYMQPTRSNTNQSIIKNDAPIYNLTEVLLT